MQPDIEAADRNAREECAAIVESIGDIEPASYVAEKIRETITPASRQDDAQSAE
jgi:hypothetical protein